MGEFVVFWPDAESITFAAEAKDLIMRKMDPGDIIFDPVFPKNQFPKNHPICAVRRVADGFDAIYLIWKEPPIRYKKIRNDRYFTHYFTHIVSVKLNKDGSVSVEFDTGSYEGIPWSDPMKAAIGRFLN